MSIRKVFGANSFNIRMLLVYDFIRPLIFALFVSTPIVWSFMGSWLTNFAYRVNIGIFLIVGSGVILLA